MMRKEGKGLGLDATQLNIAKHRADLIASKKRELDLIRSRTDRSPTPPWKMSKRAQRSSSSTHADNIFEPVKAPAEASTVANPKATAQKARLRLSIAKQLAIATSESSMVMSFGPKARPKPKPPSEAAPIALVDALTCSECKGHSMLRKNWDKCYICDGLLVAQAKLRSHRMQDKYSSEIAEMATKVLSAAVNGKFEHLSEKTKERLAKSMLFATRFIEKRDAVHEKPVRKLSMPVEFMLGKTSARNNEHARLFGVRIVIFGNHFDCIRC